MDVAILFWCYRYDCLEELQFSSVDITTSSKNYDGRTEMVLFPPPFHFMSHPTSPSIFA